MSVDAKGRLAMPKNHRDKLEENGIRELVVTADPSRCLLVYPKPMWEEVEKKVNELPNSSKYTRIIQRLYIGYATDIELDATGRMLLSSELREYAGLDRKAVLIGQGKKFELWDERTWEIESEKWKQEVNDLNPADMPVELQNISF
mgnify:CR=1 FL=1